MASCDRLVVLFVLFFTLWLQGNVSIITEDTGLLPPYLQTTKLLTTLAPAIELTDTECTSQYSCSGCHQVRICSNGPDGKFRQVSVVNCTGITPYCKEDSGTCTAIMPEKCAQLSENFVCMRESGSYPDATNCTRYHICKNFTAYTFACYGGTLYNSRTGECERTDCYKFNCANKNGLKVPYGINKNVYAYCVSGLLWFIDRCPTGYEVNELTQNCEPVCKVEGFLADSADSSSYYVCAKLPGHSVLSAQKRFCPNSTVFDTTLAHCVNRNYRSC